MSDDVSTVRRFTESWGTAADIEIESVPADELGSGDHIVVSPGERIPRAGKLVAIDGSDGDDATFAAAGETCQVTTDEGVESRSVGSRVAAGESIRDRTVIVEIGRGGIIGLLPTAGASGLSGQLGGRLAIVTLVVLITLAGAGVGALGMFSGNDGGDAGGGDTVSTPPPAPEVTVTPPGTATPEPSGTPVSSDDTPTKTPGADTPTATTTPETATPPATATPTAEETDTEEVDEPPRASVTAQAGDPPQYQAANGRVSSVSGIVTGSASWSGVDADSVVIVVQTWVPDAGWAEVERVTVSGSTLDDGTIDLETALGSVEYAGSTRTAGLWNPDPGTTVTRTGRVAVTAVVFADGREVVRTTAEDEFETTVEHVEFELDLRAGGDASFSSGAAGSESLAPGTEIHLVGNLTNSGEMAGELSLARLNVTDFENGQTAPERKVDQTGGDPGVGEGELSERLEARILVDDGNGQPEYVVGGEDSYVPLSTLTDGSTALETLPAGATAEITVELRVPADVGNEIQTDSVDMDFVFSLVSS